MTGITTALILQTILFTPVSRSYESAYHETKTSGKPLLVLVAADWCPACQTMKNEVLFELENSGKLDNVSFAIVNADTKADLANRLMRGSSIPQLIMFEPSDNGWQRAQLTGVHSSAQVERFMKQASYLR